LIYRDRIYWAKHWAGLSVIDRESGQLINFNKDIIDSVASPIAVGDKIFFPTRYKIVCTDLDGNLLYENAGYRESDFASVSQPTYHDGRLYVGTTYGGIVEFDTENLKELQRFECGGALIPVFSYTAIGAKSSSGTPIIENGKLIFSSVDGFVYFYDLKSGDLLKKINVNSPIISGITKTDKEYVVLDFDSKITLIE
jgi:outer membrane protein assembly factor BamB